MAFEQIFNENAQPIHKYALRNTCDWATAEDVVSMTLLEAWLLRRSCPSDEDAVQRWLYGITTNVLRSCTLSTQIDHEVSTQPQSGQVVPDIAEELVDRLTDAEQLSIVRVALKRLRQEEREVFALRVGEGLAHAEIADKLGVAIGTVRARLSRGRNRLRALTVQEMVRKEWRRSKSMGRAISAPGARLGGTQSPCCK
ncbi:RNA polymerase sigma factor [Streptomyces sp. NPDC059496]|uniref:RNA polymerase sigma factor n=1 Tax=Streptomyces sp. NPDC059496 TaxID=3346851 RepID=UPI00368EF80F